MSASAIAVPGSVQRDLPPSDPISTGRSRQAQPSSGTETDRVAVLAYSLWQRRGCPEGSAFDDWLQAERQLSARLSRPDS